MIPVVTIDGPSGSGKGTVSQLLARELGWHFLDSGALYRVLGVAAERAGLSDQEPAALARLAVALELAFEGERVLLAGTDVSTVIRTETAGNRASRLAALPAVRSALLERQRAFARPPGLVADGRDMGTVVFPAAPLKVFLTASPEERARRRYNQLKEKGLDGSLTDLAAEIRERDERDRSRSAAPLRAAAGALEVDSTGMTIPEVLARVLAEVRRIFPDQAGGDGLPVR
jgi:cytidylate kinase